MSVPNLQRLSRSGFPGLAGVSDDVSMNDERGENGTVLDIGSGMGIDSVTLRTVIHDDAAFTGWAASGQDDAAPVLDRLFRADPDGAQVALDQVGMTLPAWRRDALQAEIWRDQRRFDDAVDTYRRLIEEASSPARVAVLTQHLGKVRFAAGDYESARDCFARALDMRLAQSPPAAADQVESSRLALSRVEQMLTDSRAEVGRAGSISR